MIEVNNKKVKIIGTEEDLISEFVIILMGLKSMKIIKPEELQLIIDISEDGKVKEMYKKYLDNCKMVGKKFTQ